MTALVVVTTAVALSSVAPASAARPYDLYQVKNPEGSGTYARAEPRFSAAPGAFLANNTELDAACTTSGEQGRTRTLQGDHWDWTSTSTWVRLSDSSWVFDGHTIGDPNTLPACSTLPVAAAPTCDPDSIHNRCETLDPEVSRCVTSGLVKLASAPIGDPDGGTVQLWYSRTCRAGWVRAIWPQPPAYFVERADDRVTLSAGRYEDYAVEAVGRPSNLLWGRMTEANRGECISGRVTIVGQTGEFRSPTLQDCS
ncbi:hypothetical protein ACWIF8_01580 [Micromonospora chalcea]|uniref:hypothetical protein n=1 Tax=unclassified Micromonospora TaxID=2617518 RepID=UPI0033A23A64